MTHAHVARRADGMIECPRCAAYGPNVGVIIAHLISDHGLPAAQALQEAQKAAGLAVTSPTARKAPRAPAAAAQPRVSTRPARPIRPSGSPTSASPSVAPSPCGFCGRSSVGRCVKHGGPDVKEKKRAYRERPDVKEKQRAYFQRPDVKEKQRAYFQRPDVKEKKRAYFQRPDVKEKKRAYRERPDVLERQALRLLSRAQAQRGVEGGGSPVR